MAQTKVMKIKGDYFDFVIDAQKNKKLRVDFYARRAASGLYEFFQINGYDVSMETCEKLIAVRDAMVAGGMECCEFCDIILGGRGY
ncbi:MAG: hypothetical protein KAV87_14565 [Desulfobacteraceae bacterium]|nr:hypothetical protein [Desulfobacteraceae bacterium]